MRCHPHARTRSQGALGLCLDRLAGHQVQPVVLHGHGDDQGYIYRRKMAISEGEKLVARMPGRRRAP